MHNEEFEHIGKYGDCPTVGVLMKVFRIFDDRGLIRDDLCFDPEHFMEMVVREHWRDYD